jgi:hypothetical protein
MAEYCTVAAQGVPGNDDYGTMSAQEVVGELSLGVGVQVPPDELCSIQRPRRQEQRTAATTSLPGIEVWLYRLPRREAGRARPAIQPYFDPLRSRPVTVSVTVISVIPVSLGRQLLTVTDAQPAAVDTTRINTAEEAYQNAFGYLFI